MEEPIRVFLFKLSKQKKPGNYLLISNSHIHLKNRKKETFFKLFKLGMMGT